MRVREGLCRVRTWQEASTPRTAIGASALRVREGRGRAHFRRKRRNRPQPVHRRRLGSGPRRPDSRAASTGTGPGQFMLCTGSGRPGRRLSPRQSDSPGIMPGTLNTAPRGKAARGGGGPPIHRPGAAWIGIRLPLARMAPFEPGDSAATHRQQRRSAAAALRGPCLSPDSRLGVQAEPGVRPESRIAKSRRPSLDLRGAHIRVGPGQPARPWARPPPETC